MQVTAQPSKNQQQQHQLYHQSSVAVRLNVGNLPESQVRGHQQPSARAEENLDEEVRVSFVVCTKSAHKKWTEKSLNYFYVSVGTRKDSK